jgi:hypothetical protein
MGVVGVTLPVFRLTMPMFRLTFEVVTLIAADGRDDTNNIIEEI